MIYLLDTDHVSLLQSRSADADSILQRLQAIPPDDIGTTVVTLEEQFRGWADRIHQAKNSAERVYAYSKFRTALQFYFGISIWEYTEAADAQVVQWERAKVRVGTKDMRIAAIAVVNGATVLTRNTRDFGRIPDVVIEDWTV